MEFNPNQPPFWEEDGGPITDNIESYKKVRECTNDDEKRSRIAKELFEYEFGSKKHLKDSSDGKRVINNLKAKLLRLDKKLRDNNKCKRHRYFIGRRKTNG